MCLGHISPWLPYISDAGVLLPERAFFSALVNLSAGLHLLLAYVRYEHLCSCVRAAKAVDYRAARLAAWLRRGNAAGFWVGAAVSVGLALIANFQLEVDSNVHAVHPSSTSSDSRSDNATSSSSTGSSGVALAQVHSSLLPPGHHGHAMMQTDYSSVSTHVQNIHWAGAFFAFVGGITWMTLQAFLSYHTASKSLALGRLAIATASMAFFVMGVPLSLAAEAAAIEEEEGDKEGRLSSTLAVMAAGCEWAVAALIILYMTTFASEFQDLEVTRIRVVGRSSSNVDSGQPLQHQQQHRQPQQQQHCDQESESLVAMQASTSVSTMATNLSSNQSCVEVPSHLA